MPIEIEGGTEWLIYLVLMIVGAGLNTLLPYIIRKWNDPESTVSKPYIAALLLGCFMAVIIGMLSKVDVINIDMMKGALLAGIGLQTIVNKLVKAYLGKKNPEPEEESTS